MIRGNIRRLTVTAIAGVGLACAPLLAGSAPASASASAAVPKCTAADLGVWLAVDQSNGAAGTIFTPLEFTNISRHTCTLRGFPGVSAISSSGRQLGNPAVWEGGGKTTVQLAPGATAYALLGYVDAVTGNCPPGQQINAYQLRIYPPDQKQADHTYWSLPTCTVKGYSTFLRVRVIAPGIGVIGSNG